MILATPLALGSLWAFVCAVLLCGVSAARLLDEERISHETCPVMKTIAGGSIPTASPRLLSLILRVLFRYRKLACETKAATILQLSLFPSSWRG